MSQIGNAKKLQTPIKDAKELQALHAHRVRSDTLVRKERIFFTITRFQVSVEDVRVGR